MLLLIDTCILINLVHSERVSSYLTDLNNYVVNGKVKLITHQLVIDEWEKHKPQNKLRIVRKVKKLANTEGIQGGELLPTIDFSYVDIQTRQIDDLLCKAQLLDTPEVIKNEFSDRFRKCLAPFHNKKDSQNDWEVIGTVGNHCHIHHIPELYFLSSNHTDFADNLENPTKIHPDIQDRFSSVRIHYYSEISDFLREIDNGTLPEYILKYTIVKNKKFSYEASVGKHPLDSLFFVFENIYTEVAFIPPHILKKYYPFSKPVNGVAYSGIFAIHHVRDEIVEMFNAIKIDGEQVTIIDPTHFVGVKDCQNKLERVLLRLSNNLVFRLTSETGNKTANVRYRGKGTCDCVRCTYFQFEWQKSISALLSPQTELSERLKQYYFYYKLGDFGRAAKGFAELKEEAAKQKKFIIYLTCCFNLHHLGRILSGGFYNHNLSDEEISSFNQIDLLEECVKLKSYSDYDLLIYIAEGSFFTDALENIIEKTSLIEDNYYSFIRGGYSSNSNVEWIIYYFAKLETFLNQNFIVYDFYSNWDRMFAAFTKGLFASHALRGSDSSSLEHFDDYLISKLVFYSKRETLIKYFNRYNLKDLAYSPSSLESGFYKIAMNFFNNAKSIEEGYRDNRLIKSDSFNNYYQTILENIVTLAALLENEAFHTDRFAINLLDFIKKDSSFDFRHINSIRDFIQRKGKFFTKATRDKYLRFSLKTKHEPYNSPISSILLSYGKLKINPKDHSKVVKYIFGDGSNPKFRIHDELLPSLITVSTDGQKEKISEIVNNLLNENFNYSLFYKAVMSDAILLDQKILTKLFDEINLKEKSYNIRTLSTGKPSEFRPRVDELFNICFKYKVDLKLKAIVRMKNAGLYYRWLLDMDRFKYNKFEIDWINHYPTDYYYSAMAKSPKLKEYIIKYLMKTNNSRIEQALIKITYFSVQ